MIGEICIYCTLTYYALCCCCGFAEYLSIKQERRGRSRRRHVYFPPPSIPIIEINENKLSDIESCLLSDMN